jgi:hypothetical protein
MTDFSWMTAAPPAPDAQVASLADVPEPGEALSAAPPAPDALVAAAPTGQSTLPQQAAPAPDALVVTAAALQVGPAAAGAGTAGVAASASAVPPAGAAAVSELDPTSATITWTSQEPGRGRVEYGTDESYGQATPQEVANTTEHRRQLTGLTPATTYRFRATSGDEATTGTFATPAA